MKGRFTYCNPTRVHFGEGALSCLGEELDRVGDTVMLAYGQGSIKRNGVYDDVIRILEDRGKDVVEDPGVMPNPSLDKLREGVSIARGCRPDLILAVGGGSCCDYAKALSVSVYCDEDPWDRYFVRFCEPDCPIIPVGCVLTMSGTGTEMNGGAVITDTRSKRKVAHIFGEEVMPRFSILDPRLTMSLPGYQLSAGIYDTFNHICEQYFSGDDDSVSDYLAEGLMRSVVRSSRIAVKDPSDYESRSNLMWASSLALNTLISRGKPTDWMVHMIGKSIGGYTGATHGMTLSAVSMAYYRFVMPYGLHRFVRFAEEVWDVDPQGKTDERVAEEGLSRMEDWMREIGVVERVRDLGVSEDMLDALADATTITEGGYRRLSRDDVKAILDRSFRGRISS